MTSEQIKAEIWDRIRIIERTANTEKITDTDRMDILVTLLGYEWTYLHDLLMVAQITGLDLYAQLISKEMERLEKL